MASSWLNLPDDLNVSIAKRVLIVEDFIACGAVCRSWNSAASKENFSSTHQVPWLMLPEKKGTTIRDLYSLKNGKVSQLSLPELVKGKMCFSSLGWLITLSGKDCRVDLLHPLKHDLHIELPSIEEFKNRHSNRELGEVARLYGDFILSNVVLSSSPSLTSDYTALIYNWRKMAFYKAGGGGGGHEWTVTDSEENQTYADVAYYKGQFYVVTDSRSIMVCEIEDRNKQPKARVVVPPRPRIRSHDTMDYLVASAGALLLVERSPAARLQVFEVPLSTGDWSTSEVKNLGNKTLFLGYNNSSFCVEPSNYNGCQANCIYFINIPVAVQRREPSAQREDPVMTVFHMEDGKTESYRDKLPIFPSQYMWIEPSF